MEEHAHNTGRVLRLQRLIGRGGFGEVYEGEIRTATGLSRRVAIKRLRADLADGDDALLRLHDEARLLNHLRHPVVVSVEDLIPLDGHLTLISEFVDGVDLAGATPLPARAALEVIAKVAEALAAAWGQRGPDGAPLRIVHRDIKPANIRLGPHGVVKLLDFGIARTDAVTRAAKTSTGMMVGSLGYMAPERWLGEPDAHPGDVFALGCVLYEALVGQALFFGLPAPAQVGLAMDPARQARFLDDRLAALPADARRAERLLREMLALAPDQRPSAAEVADRATALAARVRGESLLAWSARLDDLPPPAESDRVDSAWIEGPSGFSRVTDPIVPPVPTLETDRPARPSVPATAPRREPVARRTKRGSWAMVLGLGVALVGSFAVAAVVIGAIGAWSAGLLEPAVELAGTAPGEPAGASAAAGEGAIDAEDLGEPADAAAAVEAPDATPPAPPPPTPVPASPPAPRPAVLSATSQAAASTPERAAVAAPAPERAPVPEPPEAAPEPAPQPVAPVVATAPMGTVIATPGSNIRLRGPGGVVATGAVPVGEYVVEASFDPGSWIETMRVRVREGAVVRIECKARFRQCIEVAP